MADGADNHNAGTRLLVFLGAFIQEWAHRLSLFLDSLLFDFFGFFNVLSFPQKATMAVKSTISEEQVVEEKDDAVIAVGNTEDVFMDEFPPVSAEDDTQDQEIEDPLQVQEEEIQTIVENLQRHMLRPKKAWMIPVVRDLMNLAIPNLDEKDIEQQIQQQFKSGVVYEQHNAKAVSAIVSVLTAAKEFEAQKLETVSALMEFAFPQLLGLIHRNRQSELTEQEKNKQINQKKATAIDNNPDGYPDLYPAEKFEQFLVTLFSALKHLPKREFLRELEEISELNVQLKQTQVKKVRRAIMGEIEIKAKMLIQMIWKSDVILSKEEECLDFYLMLIPHSDSAEKLAKGNTVKQKILGAIGKPEDKKDEYSVKYEQFDLTLQKFIDPKGLPKAFQVKADAAIVPVYSPTPGTRSSIVSRTESVSESNKPRTPSSTSQRVSRVEVGSSANHSVVSDLVENAAREDSRNTFSV